MARIIITGGSGLLGLNWAVQASNDHEVHLWLHQRTVSLAGTISHHVDLSLVNEISKALDEIKPDIVVNASGYTSVDGCEFNSLRSEISNFKNAQNIALATAQRGIKLIHISTDHLFDGSEGFIDENHPKNPQNNYALHKAKAEDAVQRIHFDALILRTTFFGWGPSYRRSFSDLILDDLAAGRQVKMFDDVFFTPLYSSYLITIAHQLLDVGHKGVLNICGNERISKYDFSVKLAQAFGYDATTIQPVQASRLRNGINRPFDLSLSDKKLCLAIGGSGVDIDASIAALKKDEALSKVMRQQGKVIPYGKHG